MPRVWYAIAFATLIAGCAAPPSVRGPERASSAGAVPTGFEGSRYEEAAAQGPGIYRVSPEDSLVAVLVRRGGSLAHLGHDHVVASHGVRGYVAAATGAADLYVPLADLSVDEPALRAEAGLDTQPSDTDIAGTRSNMLDKVLETQRFPFAFIRINQRETMPSGARLDVALTLHGVTRTFEVPAQIQKKNGEMQVAGTLEFNQSDFGMTPFSILGGAIQVQDRLSLRFRILARPFDARS